MVGIRTLCLLALALEADGLLTRRGTPCSNSDGVAGYNFSHRGLWIPGYDLAGTGFTKQSCSVECSKRKGCVAFSGAFRELGGNGACYTYTATGKNVASGKDRAYKKCVKSAESIPGAVGLAVASAEQAPTIEALALMAEGMEKQLDAVSLAMSSNDKKMRKLKSMVAGTAAMLTDASRLAAEASSTATENRGGLKTIARNKKEIGMAFEALTSSKTRMATLLAKIKKGSPSQSAGDAKTTKALAHYEPNVTALEKSMNQLNDPKTMKEITSLVTGYKAFKGKIIASVKAVLQTDLRALVDTQRKAYRNYTDALTDKSKKDPCCCK